MVFLLTLIYQDELSENQVKKFREKMFSYLKKRHPIEIWEKIGYGFLFMIVGSLIILGIIVG